MTPASPRPAVFSWRTGLGLAGLLAAILLAAYASLNTELTLALVAGAAVAVSAALLWQAPGLILIALLFNVWLVSGRADPADLLHNYTFVRWLSYLIIPAFTVLVVMRVFARHRRWRLTGLEPYLAILILLTFLSGLVNNTGLLAIVLSLAVYFRYPLLFLVLYNLHLGEKTYLGFARVLLLVAIALIGEAIVNGLLLGRRGDFIFFTTGVQYGTSNAGLLMIYAACLVFAHALVTRWRWYHIAFLVGLGLAGWLAQIRSLLVLVPFLPATMWAVRHRLIGRRRLPWLALFGLLGIVGIVLALGPTLSNNAFDVRFFIQLRTIGVNDVLSVMAKQNRQWLGFGPRSYNPGSLGSAGEMYRLELASHGQYWVTQFAIGELATGFVELGLIGFGVYWLMLAGVLVRILRFWREFLNRERDPQQRQRWSLITLAFVGVWTHYALLGLVYYDIWRLDATSLVFWAIAAALYAHERAWRQLHSETAI